MSNYNFTPTLNGLNNIDKLFLGLKLLSLEKKGFSY